MRARDRTDNVDSKSPRRARWLLIALAGAAAALAYSLVGSLSQLAALTASVTHTTDRRGIELNSTRPPHRNHESVSDRCNHEHFLLPNA